MSAHAGVNAMLAIELLTERSFAEGDREMLAICAEAWERGGWCIGYLYPRHTIIIQNCRHRKNRAKLRHQADALLAVVRNMPLDERGWHHLRWHGAASVLANPQESPDA